MVEAYDIAERIKKKNCYKEGLCYLTIRLRARVFYEQTVNEAQPIARRIRGRVV